MVPCGGRREGYKEQMRVLVQAFKNSMKREMKKESRVGFLLSNNTRICRHFVFLVSAKNSFSISCLKVLTHLRSFISADRLFEFHVFGPR